MKPYELTMAELSESLRRRELSALEATDSYLDRIGEIDPAINAYITVSADQARDMAREADRRLAEGNPPPLCGVPIALKDIFLTRGVRTTCASRILSDFIPPYDATAWRKVADQGAVLLGKLNMDEFAMGSSCEGSFFGPTRNPWDRDRVPGGSSGGSAAAVAARLAAGTLGTDTGGSIRQPASHCGCVGLKPTYGRVSRYGVIAYASSLDQVGPMTRTVEDAALLLGAIAGHDPLDSTSVDRPVPDYRKSLLPDLKGVRIGLPAEYLGEGLDPEVRRVVEEGIARCRGLGADLVEITLPHTRHAVASYYLIATAEASSNLARYDGVRFGYRCEGELPLAEMFSRSRAEGFGTEVKRRIMLGTHALSSGYYDAYYLTAQKVRTLIRNDFSAAFDAVDIILTPVAPTPAFRIGEKVDDPLTMYLSDIFTIPVNLAGTCALSVPAGFTEGGLPVGIQFIGRPFEEGTLLRAGHAFELSSELSRRFPAMEGRG